MSNFDDAAELVPDRDCGPCSLCCKVFPIPQTRKPDFGWCPRARPQGGCSAYARRPKTCREFFCLWRLDASLGEEWRPDIAGFVLHDPEPWTLLVSCDVDNPDAWRREPYGSEIRIWAKDLQRRQQLMGLRVGATTKLLLADREVVIDAG